VDTKKKVRREHFPDRADGSFHDEGLLLQQDYLAIVPEAFYIDDLIQLDPDHLSIDAEIQKRFGSRVLLVGLFGCDGGGFRKLVHRSEEALEGIGFQ